MADFGCSVAMQLMNIVFDPSIILNDGHEIHDRLEAGDEIPDIVEEFARKFGAPDQAAALRRVLQNWPPLHIEAVGQMVQWALGKLDTDDRVTINWKGDAEHAETVTKFELRDHLLVIEFAHPGGSLGAAGAGA